MTETTQTSSGLKYLIIGAGGTGGAIGAYLAHSGQDTTFIARGRHLAAMRGHGLIVHTTRIENFTVNPVQAFTMEEYLESGMIPDVIFLCVKYYSLKETITFINKVATPNTLVIPVLNIFGTGGDVQKECPGCTVLDGCIYIFGMIEEPGVIVQPSPIFRVLFGYREGQEHTLETTAQQVQADLENAGIDSALTDTIKRDALQKFSFVSPMGAAGLYYNAVGGDFMMPGEKHDTLMNLIREVENLGHAMGLSFPEDLITVNKRILNGMTSDSTTSMQRDVANGRTSEIDGLVHRVVRLADQYGADVPTYKMISQWAKEQGIK